MSEFNEFSFLLQIERALLDAVIPELRAVTYDIDFVKLYFDMDFIFDEEINNRYFDIASVATGDIDLPFDRCDWRAITIKYPEPIPFRSRCAYCRYEPNLPTIPKIQIPWLEKPYVPIARLQALMNQALLGRATPNLRQVTLDLDTELKKLSFQFAYDGEISDLDKRLAASAFEESTLSYVDYEKEFSMIRVDFPQKCPKHGKRYAYSREEYPNY